MSLLLKTWLKLWSHHLKVACSAAGRRVLSQFCPGTERGFKIRAASAHFHSPPKVRSVPGRSPSGHRPYRAFAVERFRWRIDGERSIRSVSGRRTPGHRAYFGALPITGGRWETARVSVGHRSVTAGTPPGEALRFRPGFT